jgi:hypothetical protein
MADLLIRYVNGRCTLAIDYADRPKSQEAVLHDKSRERRLPIPADLENVPMKRLLKLFRLAMGNA